MNSENASLNNPIAQMDNLLEKIYLEIMVKEIELARMRENKDPAADDFAIALDQKKEHYDRLSKTHAIFLRTRKNRPGISTNAETQKEFEHLIAEMKSSTMGTIVDKIPPPKS